MGTFTVSNLNDWGTGSLRDAITAANADTGSPVIQFTVNGTITLASDLPAITKGVVIDGTTAPTHVAGRAPVVEVDFNGHAGLMFSAGSDGSQLLGLAVCNATGNGVTLNAGSITLAGNYIGLNLAGGLAGNTGDAVHVSSTSSQNLIGLNPNTLSHVISNVISGNGGNGMEFEGSTLNTLVNNYIGTDPTGKVAVPNVGNGIHLTAGSHANEIGGTAFTDADTGDKNDPTGNKGKTDPTFVVPPLGNLVSGNGQNGILIDSGSRNNILNGNFIGTTADGHSPLGNQLDGVAIKDADNNSLIGCTFEQMPFVYYNVLSGNGANGLHVTDSDGTTIQANFFGIDANNSVVVPNTLDGVLIDGDSKNTLMGGPIPLGNVASGNGIEVADTASFFISFNTFGGLFAFGDAAPNGQDGIRITSIGGNQMLQTNAFSGNLDDGIDISGDAFGVTVDPNIAGLNTGAITVLPNMDNGLEISGNAHDNVIGGHMLSLLPFNIFAGNFGYGIVMRDNAHGNWVFNTYVGADEQVTGALPNLKGGILIAGAAHDNKIGDVASLPGQSNVVIISGNGGNGITLGDGTTRTTILNNLIGLTKAGDPLPNFGVPIDTGLSTNNIIEGNQTVACSAAGTRIATPGGEVAVEHLRVRDVVLTHEGRTAPIRWIGHRHIDCRRHPAPAKVQPVRIAAHAFGRNRPARELLLSPDHAVHIDEVLIPIKYLVNNTTIVPARIHIVTYYHLELDRHDVVFAEGLPTESYRDTGDRSSFANGGPNVALHPEWGRPEVALIMDALGCAPLVVTGPQVAQAHSQLIANAVGS